MRASVASPDAKFLTRMNAGVSFGKLMNQEFLQAVREGNLEKVKKLVEQSRSLVDYRDDNGVSAVLLAIYDGHRDLARYLAEKGAQLSVFDAAALGRADLVEAFLNEDPNLAHAYSLDGFTALGLACFFGNNEVVDLLLGKGSDPNAASRNPMRVTPLHSAVANRDAEKAFQMTKSLLRGGAEVNVAQEGGWTPLHQAAAHGQTAIVKMLLEHGADSEAKSRDGRTPLEMAANGAHKEAEQLLRHHSSGKRD